MKLVKPRALDISRLQICGFVKSHLAWTLKFDAILTISLGKYKVESLKLTQPTCIEST